MPLDAEIMKFGVIMVPGLVVDGEVKVAGLRLLAELLFPAERSARRSAGSRPSLLKSFMMIMAMSFSGIRGSSSGKIF